MSSNRRRYDHARNLFRRPAGFRTYYDIGVAASRRMPTFRTLREIGEELKITKQNAYTECVVALGKLLYRLSRIIQEAPEL